MTTRYTEIEAGFHDYIDQKSDASMNSLMQACQGLVFHYAKLYGGGYCFDDLCQSGYEGLLKAIRDYDPTYGTKFVTYASHGIIGEIRHYVRKESRYYYPGYLEDYRDLMNKIILEHLAEGVEPMSSEELASRLNLKPDSIYPVMSAGLVHLGHLEIASIKTKEMESFALPVEDKLLLSQLKYRLTGIQKDVIEMLFQRGMTQEEVAVELELTQKQVSRIKLKSLQKMKDAIKK